MNSRYRLGVDTGGTFTDLCLLDEGSGRMEVAKVSSTPHDPAEAVIEGILKLMEDHDLEPAAIGFLIHGTTVATNALLEGKGAPTALITTAGFEDVILIGRQNRPKLYDFWARRPTPIVPPSLCFGAPERVLPSGEVLRPLDEEAVRKIIAAIKAKGINSVAVCLLHSYANGAHEQRIKALVEELHPGAFITLSCEVLPEYREYERTSHHLHQRLRDAQGQRLCGPSGGDAGRAGGGLGALHNAVQRGGHHGPRRPGCPAPGPRCPVRPEGP